MMFLEWCPVSLSNWVLSLSDTPACHLVSSLVPSIGGRPELIHYLYGGPTSWAGIQTIVLIILRLPLSVAAIVVGWLLAWRASESSIPPR